MVEQENHGPRVHRTSISQEEKKTTKKRKRGGGGNLGKDENGPQCTYSQREVHDGHAMSRPGEGGSKKGYAGRGAHEKTESKSNEPGKGTEVASRDCIDPLKKKKKEERRSVGMQQEGKRDLSRKGRENPTQWCKSKSAKANVTTPIASTVSTRGNRGQINREKGRPWCEGKKRREKSSLFGEKNDEEWTPHARGARAARGHDGHQCNEVPQGDQEKRLLKRKNKEKKKSRSLAKGGRRG